MDPSVEQDIMQVMNLTEQLEENSKIELHSVRVETPRVAIEYRLSDLKIKIRAARIYFKSIVGVFKQIFAAFFIYFVYTIFRDSVAMIKKYQDDVAFANSFVTREFWMIDEFRKAQGQTHLSHFSKQEKKDWKVMEVFSFPTKAERSKAIRPFFKWFTLAVTVAVVIILDYYLYTFLDSVCCYQSIITLFIISFRSSSQQDSRLNRKRVLPPDSISLATECLQIFSKR